jgi:predicted nucleotidyltransferase
MAAMTLDELVAQLRAAYGDGLRAVVLYGSAARAEGSPRSGRAQDVLVVVDRLGIDELRRVAPTARAWQEAGHPAPLTLTMREWRSSADVFPMEYADVLDAHRVLHGALPTDGVAVNPADLRRQVEHQVLGKLLQLRAGVLAAGNDGKRQLALLEASRGTMLVLFRALARVHGQRPAGEPEALATWAGTTAGFDAGPFVRVVRHAAGTARLIPADAAGVLAGELDGLERLVAHVDALNPPGPGPA